MSDDRYIVLVDGGIEEEFEGPNALEEATKTALDIVDELGTDDDIDTTGGVQIVQVLRSWKWEPLGEADPDSDDDESVWELIEDKGE